MFSKSFGYALRGVLYVAMMSNQERKVSIDEIAGKLGVPKHFLGKIMNKIVKADILNSAKGSYGGLSVNENTLTTTLLAIYELTEGEKLFTYCALGLKECDPNHPCPVHFTVEKIKADLVGSFSGNTIGELLNGNNQELLLGISTR